MTTSDVAHQTRTQEEAISYECANEALTHAMAVVSAEIDAARRGDTRDGRNLQRLTDLRAGMARERASLYKLDPDAIIAVRSTYGAIVRSGREGLAKQNGFLPFCHCIS